MKDLAESLQKAVAGDAPAAEHACLLFGALTNDKSILEILRSSKEHFEHCQSAVKVCFELAQGAQLRSLLQKPPLSDQGRIRLEERAQTFLSSYLK